MYISLASRTAWHLASNAWRSSSRSLLGTALQAPVTAAGSNRDVRARTTVISIIGEFRVANTNAVLGILSLYAWYLGKATDRWLRCAVFQTHRFQGLRNPVLSSRASWRGRTHAASSCQGKLHQSSLVRHSLAPSFRWMHPSAVVVSYVVQGPMLALSHFLATGWEERCNGTCYFPPIFS